MTTTSNRADVGERRARLAALAFVISLMAVEILSAAAGSPTRDTAKSVTAFVQANRVALEVRFALVPVADFIMTVYIAGMALTFRRAMGHMFPFPATSIVREPTVKYVG